MRIKDNSIRIRLSILELGSLTKNVSVNMKTPLNNNFLSTTISIKKECEINFSNGHISIFFPITHYSNLLNSDDEGFSHQFVFDNDDEILNVAIEKDFKCIGRDTALNKGLFNNPKNDNEAC